MGFLAKFAASISLQPHDDGRAYERFHSELDALMHVETSAGERLAIADVSFGGLAVRQAGDADPGTKQVLNMRVLDQKLSVPVELVRAVDGVKAYRFAGRGMEALVVLHSLLRGLEAGASLHLKLPSGLEDDGSHRYILSSKMRTRLKLIAAPDGTLQRLILAAESEGRPWEFAVVGNAIVVARAGAGAQLPSGGIRTGMVEKLVVRQATYVLSALKLPEVRALVLNPLALCLRELGLSTDGGDSRFTD